MSTSSVTISGLLNGMTADEVKQRLAALYKVPETHFEELCHALFVTKEPHILVKKVDQLKADMHVKKLTELGFACGSDAEGLSLAPVLETNAADVICPACGQSAGDAEMCQQCGVMMKKYQEQRNFDEKFQQQMKAKTSGHEKMKQVHAEKTQKRKTQAIAKKAVEKKNSGSDKLNDDERTYAEDEVVTVDSTEKTNKWLYAAVASGFFTIIGGGIAANELFNNRFVGDELVMAADAGSIATDIEESVNMTSTNHEEQLAPAPKSVFERRAQRAAELKLYENRINSLVAENLRYSVKGLILTKEDLRDRLFGNQTLIELVGLNEDTEKMLLDTLTLASEMEGELDRVDALLKQSGLYTRFERDEIATETYELAARVAFDIDDMELRIIAETAIAEHHVEFGELEGAHKRYQAAKDKVLELVEPPLMDQATAFIALSEATHDLTQDAMLTAELLADELLRENTLLGIKQIASKNGVVDLPGVAAAHETGWETEDPLLHELIEMTKQNQLKLKAASSLLKQ